MGFLPGQLWKASTRKLKPIWILMNQETMRWQWHQLDHMQIVCTSLQTVNHASTSSLHFFTGRMLFLMPNQQYQSIKGKIVAALQQKNCKKVKAFPYSIPSVGPGADPGVQADSPQVTVSYTPGGRLPLISARPAVTSPAAQHHRPLAGTKFYCLVTEAHRYKQLAQGCYAALPRAGFEPATY